MPIYEYQCEACGHYLETLQKISDPPLTDCHKCGKPALKKLVSAAAFRLKGGGWRGLVRGGIGAVLGLPALRRILAEVRERAVEVRRRLDDGTL